MAKNDFIGLWAQRFLVEYLIGERNLSLNTQASYRDTLVLLLPFLAKRKRITVDKLILSKVSADDVRVFLQYLEKDRECSVSTRNQRLAAIHAWARFIALRSPEHIAWASEIVAISFKKGPKPALPYLEKVEMDALLDCPNVKTEQGKRDYAVLLFLYNAGARVSEAAELKISDLSLKGSPSVRISGKGRKIRHCPLWALTVKAIAPLIEGRSAHESVFMNCRRQPITRFGIYTLVHRCAAKASERVQTLKEKRIGPHTIRHTTAVHLLRSGVDINTIRAWLGHVSLDTTNIYAVVDLEMKARALAHCEIMTKKKIEKRLDGRGTMAFLKSL